MTGSVRKPPYDAGPPPPLVPLSPDALYLRITDRLASHDYGAVVATAFYLLSSSVASSMSIASTLEEIRSELADLNTNGIPSVLGLVGDLSDRTSADQARSAASTAARLQAISESIDSKLPLSPPTLLASLQSITDAIRDVVELAQVASGLERLNPDP
uniref:Uncharacterized protein n=1 Tax=viral metagenome TaxID=1070528 RepID=A0A6H1ZWY8_9ZZZZ